jgi:hypothetical protein
MLGACGPILFAHWLARHGPRRAVGLAVRSMVVFLALLAPFLIWNPNQFFEVTFLSRGAFPPDVMSGRFTLLPFFSGIVPHASLTLTLIAVFVAAVCAMRARRPEAVVTAMALGLCGTLLFQPVSFSHYFLPVIALMATAPLPLGGPGTDAPGTEVEQDQAGDRIRPGPRRLEARLQRSRDSSRQTSVG